MTQTAKERQEQYARKIVETIWRLVLQRVRLPGEYRRWEQTKVAESEVRLFLLKHHLYTSMRTPGKADNHVRTIASVVIRKLLPDGGVPSDATPEVLQAIKQLFDQYSRAAEAAFDAGNEAVRRETRICLGCAGGKLAGPQHMEECHRYAAVEDVPSYAGMRRPGESATDVGIRLHKAFEEAHTEPPPAPVVEHECPSCGSKKISYNARADVWRCPLCSWSKRQLVAPPPGPKFKIGDWVGSHEGGRSAMPMQVMGIQWWDDQTPGPNSQWLYTVCVETARGRVRDALCETLLHPCSEADRIRLALLHKLERQASKMKRFSDVCRGKLLPGSPEWPTYTPYSSKKPR